jgi:hypothetical protein
MLRAAQPKKGGLISGRCKRVFPLPQSAMGPTEPSGQWMLGSSSPEVTRNIMILRVKSQKKKYIYKRITVLKIMEREIIARKILLEAKQEYT